MQSNNFMYSNEAFHVTELMLKKMTKVTFQFNILFLHSITKTYVVLILISMLNFKFSVKYLFTRRAVLWIF